MKIAIVGTRGIPARYGGFETLADRLATNLAQRGHEVTVYCRRAFTTPRDNFDPRIRRVILPGLSSKHFDTLFHTFLSAVHVTFTDAEVVLICNVANSPWAWMPRLAGKPTVLNVDGLDRNRRKWNWLGRAFLHFCEALAVLTPTRVLTDSLAIQNYYRRRYHRDSAMIAYGAEAPDNLLAGPERFGLERTRYILYVSRFEPENNPDLVLRAYAQVRTDWPLVMVGDNPYRPEYVEQLKAMADSRVMFTGAVYGDGYWILQKNAGIYISGCEIGGTHPAMVEAMAAANPTLYLDTAENRETMGDTAIPFSHDPAELAQKLDALLRDGMLRDDLSVRARKRAATVFSWDTITRQYEALFEELAGKKPRVVIATD